MRQKWKLFTLLSHESVEYRLSNLQLYMGTYSWKRQLD